MKTLLIILISMLGTSLLSNCTKLIYSHEQVLSSYRTKDDVTRQFGAPDEKRKVNQTEEWLYSCDSASVFAESKTKVKMNGSYNTVYGDLKHSTANVERFTLYKRYVKFTFNEQGVVINRDSYGVDFAERKRKKGATVALIAGISVGVLLTIGYFAALHTISTWGN